MRVPDACRYIGISRSTLYLLIAAGEIEIIKLGSSTLVLTESLKALIAKRRSLSADHSVQIGR
jgi:excisionase family DNA binding protein